MIDGISYSKPLAIAVLAELAAIVALVLLHGHLNRERVARGRTAAELEGSLSRQISVKADFDEENVNILRSRLHHFRMQLGREGLWQNLASQLGDIWDAQPGTRDVRDGCTIQKETLTLRSPDVVDWPRIVDAVDALERAPGVGIVSFEMKTHGDRTRRSVDVVKLEVEIRTLRSRSLSSTP